MATVELRFLDRAQVTSLLPDTAECQRIIEQGLIAHGRQQVVLPPKVHLHMPDPVRGHFNILPGYVGPLDTAGIKVVSDFMDNYDHDLPSEVALLTLYDPHTGTPKAIMDATVITWLRTGTVTAVGAKLLARPESAVVGHLGARGTAFANLQGLAHLFPLQEVRIVSARRETRARLANRVRDELGVPARAVDSVAEAAEGADIVIEATRLHSPQALLETAMLKPGALLVTYGWILAMERSLPLAMDKLVVDDWAQCCKGGQLFPLIEAGELSSEHVYAEIGQIAARLRTGRERDEERILFWHRGFAISDIVLGQYLLDRAEQQGIGTMLTLGTYGRE